MIATEYVPKDKFKQFHEILCATGGRYLSEPFTIYNVVQVNYEAGDYVAQSEAWIRCLTPIREVNKNQWWRIVLRRFWFSA